MSRTAGTYEVVFKTPPPRPETKVPSTYIAPDSHRQHGERAKYVIEGCHCTPCKEANRTYARELGREKARGDPPRTVHAVQVRRHIEYLATQGIGRRQVAALAGLSDTTVWKIRTGQVKRVGTDTARRILALTSDQRAPAATVDATETWRMLDALLAKGWTRKELARRLGSTATVPTLQLRRDLVLTRNAEAVVRLYNELWPVAPPPRKTRWNQ